MVASRFVIQVDDQSFKSCIKVRLCSSVMLYRYFARETNWPTVSLQPETIFSPGASFARSRILLAEALFQFLGKRTYYLGASITKLYPRQIHKKLSLQGCIAKHVQARYRFGRFLDRLLVCYDCSQISLRGKPFKSTQIWPVLSGCEMTYFCYTAMTIVYSVHEHDHESPCL